MVHHGVSVTYTLFGYPASSAPSLRRSPPSPSPTYLPPPSFDRPASLNFLSLSLPFIPLSLSFSLLRFVPHRRSRDQDVLQNKRLYLHARPSEKPPLLVVEDDVNRRRELASFRPNALVAARNKVVYYSCISIVLWLKEFRKKKRCVNVPHEKSSFTKSFFNHRAIIILTGCPANIVESIVKKKNDHCEGRCGS